MGGRPSLEQALEQRKEIRAKIAKQETLLMELDALKRTFVKAMVKDHLFMGLPMSNYSNCGSSVIQVADQWPFLILNVGEVISLSSRVIVPINYRVLRRYKKSKVNKRSGDDTWYTTTVLSKNDEIYLVIRDDENNVWKGPDAFTQLFRSFEGGMAFTTALQWLGVDKEEVQEVFRAQKSYKKLLERSAERAKTG